MSDHTSPEPTRSSSPSGEGTSTSRRPELSVVVPVYKAQDTLVELTDRLRAALGELTDRFEIIYVEDAGGDRSWEIIREIAAEDPRVRGIRFCRNFGQHFALTAGLDHAEGAWVVTMDCDLQDPPEHIADLYRRALEGYEVVTARRIHEGGSPGGISRAISRAFYRLFDYLADTRTDPAIGTFRIMSHRVVRAFRQMREQMRFFGGLLQWLGFRSTTIDFAQPSRGSRRSTYTFRKRLDLALVAIVSFSNRPLLFSIKLGFVIAAFALAFAAHLVYRKLFQDIPVPGWTSTIVSVYFLGGLLMINMGILGIYIGKVFDQTKGRPLYVIEEATFGES